jgi:hypothetical protein
MQIPPSNSLLQALSSTSASPAARPVRPQSTEAAREAARAVFAQLKTPVAAAPGPAPLRAPTVQTSAPTTPTTQPRRPMPRGSIVNILV